MPMSDQSPLIVPMIVEALVVNDAVRTPRRQIVTFMRTEMTYGAMQQCGSGQPFLDDNDLDFTGPGLVPPNNVPASRYYNGVYLKWRLPRAYTHGSQDSAAGVTTYRQVPNRWLVVRYSGPLGARAARAWIVESDYLYPTSQPPSPSNVSQEASMYVQAASPSDPTPVGCRIGRNVALGAWAESGHTLNLTAMAPGNPAFAFYQPQCNNVFSFVDCLAGQPAETLSYLVLGWFSSLANDPLAPGLATAAATPSFLARLQALGWTLPAGTDPTLTASWSLLCGSVNGVEWQRAGLPPGGTPEEAKSPVSVAVGNTAVEALTAMITGQASADSTGVDAQLLEAFQLDAVDVLDRPDGAALLAEKLQATHFQKLSGGYSWSIVDAPDANTPVSEQELAAEAAWLAVLSRNQQSLDRAILQLASLQSSLYTMWWKYTLWPFAYQGSSAIPCLDDQTALQQQLDPTVAGSLAQQTAQQLESVKCLLAQV